MDGHRRSEPKPDDNPNDWRCSVLPRNALSNSFQRERTLASAGVRFCFELPAFNALRFDRLGPTFEAMMRFRKMALNVAILLVATGSATCVLAETNQPPTIRQIAPGRYSIGDVTLDAHSRSLSFPAKVNMTDGLAEYWLVHESGKVHESLFATSVRANEIHMAALLLSNTATVTNVQVAAFGAEKPVQISVSWRDPGEPTKLVKFRAEELVENLERKEQMSAGVWTYNGSRIVEGTFIAHRDGSLIAIMSDQDALVNNPRPGRENDEIWKIRKAAMPPVSTAVEITISFNQQASSTPK